MSKFFHYENCRHGHAVISFCPHSPWSVLVACEDAAHPQRQSWRCVDIIGPTFNQRIAKGAGGKGPRQKSSKSVKKFSTLFDNFRAGPKRQKSSKSVKIRHFFDNFGAAPVFRPLLGGSDLSRHRVKWGRCPWLQSLPGRTYLSGRDPLWTPPPPDSDPILTWFDPIGTRLNHQKQVRIGSRGEWFRGVGSRGLFFWSRWEGSVVPPESPDLSAQTLFFLP